MFYKRKKITTWGLDIGDKSIKLASLSPQGSKYSVVNYNSVAIPAGAFDNGKIIEEKIIIDQIHDLINTAKGPKLKTKFVHSCLPETQTYIKLISIPEMTDKEIPEAVRWASEHHIPLPPDQIYLDWQIVNHDQIKKEINVLIGAAPKDISDSYTQLIKNCGLIPLSLEIEATAIARALINEEILNNDEEALAIIDIGAARSSLIIYSKSSIQFTSSLPFAGDEVTKTISTELSLTSEQAEQAKIICGLDDQRCAGALKQVLDKKVHELIDRINSALEFYKQEFKSDVPINKIVLCGGGSHFSGIDELLSEKLSITTVIGDLKNKCIFDPNLKFPKNKLLAYTTAFGLALKAYE